MARLVFLTVLTCLLTSATLAHAQAEGESAAGATTESSPADAAWSAISEELRLIYKSINNKGGIEATDKPVLHKMLERVQAFTKQHPSDHRGLAAELLISEWLGEKSKVESLYKELLAKSPNNDALTIAYARRLQRQNLYSQAIDVLRAHTFKTDNTVEAMRLLSECLFAENQFAESLTILENISEEALQANAVLKPQVEGDKALRRRYIDLWQAETEIRNVEKQANDLPLIVMNTSKGPIILELFENEAPNTVANFIKLAEQGYYNDTKFHRVEPNFMAQGGDPNTRPDASAGAVPGMGGPGYTIPDEHNDEKARMHFAGSLSMANTGTPNSGGSQFFITHQPTPHLNNKHTVFGRVVDGMDVARSLQVNDELMTVEIKRKRDHAYEPNTLTGPGSGGASPALGSMENPIEINVPITGGTVTATMPSSP